ncbi:hypothetical protein MKW94_000627 [Papaver nudicaule]|uniref:DUF7950 domain-containing protein n=1 Tax=Papaver nudicaule TaxID=74823 RepID=A0AA41VZE4_PAPNU|nr:hypothetical protein [Papaver nudicaule]
MDSRGGGCCIARYDGGARNPYDASKIDRIMLRFRPIAPKPVASGSGSGSGEEKASDVLIKNGGRTKRKYVKDATKTRRKNSGQNSKKRKPSSDQHHSVQADQTAVLTLPLLPEKTNEATSPSALLPLNHHLTVGNGYVPAAWCQNSTTTSPASSSGGSWSGSGRSGGGGLSTTTTSTSSTDRTVVIPQPVRPVGSCVTVSSIITEEVGLGFLGRTDEEKKINLEKDTCPGFISDGLNRVIWTNEAYRKLVNQDGFGCGGVERPEMVWLVMNESLPLRSCEEGFVCRVKLQYTCNKERHSLIVPCDVWKMNGGGGGGGGFAWRLDVKAALSLGR